MTTMCTVLKVGDINLREHKSTLCQQKTKRIMQKRKLTKSQRKTHAAENT